MLEISGTPSADPVAMSVANPAWHSVSQQVASALQMAAARRARVASIQMQIRDLENGATAVGQDYAQNTVTGASLHEVHPTGCAEPEGQRWITE